jgi:tetratricopeptide (TPR) repeat protein
VIALLPLLALTAHAQARTWIDSITLWSRAIEVVGPEPELLYELARAFQAAGRADEAIAQLTEAHRLDPRSAVVRDELVRAHNQRGVGLVEGGRIDEGIAHYEAALRTLPDSAETFNNLGAALILQGRLGDAQARLDRAVALRPGYARAHVNLAAVHYLDGRYEEAWSEIALARRGGLEPPSDLVAGLTQKMPPP